MDDEREDDFLSPGTFAEGLDPEAELADEEIDDAEDEFGEEPEGF